MKLNLPIFSWFFSIFSTFSEFYIFVHNFPMICLQGNHSLLGLVFHFLWDPAVNLRWCFFQLSLIPPLYALHQLQPPNSAAPAIKFPLSQKKNSCAHKKSEECSSSAKKLAPAKFRKFNIIGINKYYNSLWKYLQHAIHHLKKNTKFSD